MERFRTHRQDRFSKLTREADYSSEQESATNKVTERLGFLEKQIDSLVKMQMQKQVNDLFHEFIICCGRHIISQRRQGDLVLPVENSTVKLANS